MAKCSMGILNEMTLDDVKAFNAEVVVWALGSTEPHGPALPYGTDHVQADAVVRRGTILANSKGARVMMYPTMPIGCNANFQAWPFACRIAPQTFMQLILDVIEMLEQDGIRKIVIFDGHGGNSDVISAALRAHAHRRPPGSEGAFVCKTHGGAPDSAITHPSYHGGESEVSMQLHLNGELVHEDKIDNYPFGELAVDALDDPSVSFVKPWHLAVPASCVGDQREASAERGEVIINHSAERLAELLCELSAAEFNENFPYKG